MYCLLIKSNIFIQNISLYIGTINAEVFKTAIIIKKVAGRKLFLLVKATKEFTNLAL